MKIAHLTTHINMGGIPIYIYTLAKALRERGVEQIVLSSGGSMEQQFIQGQISTFRFNLKTKFEFHPKALCALPAIMRLLKNEKVDLIHAHTRVAQVIAWLIEKMVGTPYISTCHGIYSPRLSRRMLPAWGKTVVAISEPVKQNLVHTHKIKLDRVRRIRNGIEIERFVQASEPFFKEKARQKFLFSPSDFVLCMSARVISEKGVGDFLETLQILSMRSKKFKGLIIGDGPDKLTFQEKAASLGIESIVGFTGEITDVAPALAASDVFIHPVRVPEGFGLSIAEAMAVGLPVIVTDQWALMNLMADRNIGEFVSIKNPQKIAAIIESWMSQPEKMKVMGRNAQAAAVEFFDIRRMASEVLQVYKEVLGIKEIA